MSILKKNRAVRNDRIFHILAMLFSGSLFLSYLSTVLPPERFSLLAFFGLSYPLLILLNIISAVYWLVRRPLLSVIPLSIILTGYPFLNATFGIYSNGLLDTARSGSIPIKVLSYNVHFFQGSEGKDAWLNEEILNYIKGEQPDIVCLQEFLSVARRLPTTVDSLSSSLKTSDYYFRVNSINPYYCTEYGMAIYSKYPIISKRWIKLSDQHNQCLVVDLKKGDKTLRVYNVHLESIGLQQGNPGNSPLPSNPFGVYLAIGSSLKRAFIARAEQVKKIKEDAARSPYPYIIAGDFNDTPVSYAVHQLSKGMKNAFAEKGQGFCKTYNGSYPNFQIDYILASQEFDVLNYRVEKLNYSDHYPVIAELDLPGKPVRE